MKNSDNLIEDIEFEELDITIDKGKKDDIVTDDNGNNYIVGEDRKLTKITITKKAHLVEGTPFITKEKADLQEKFRNEQEEEVARAGGFDMQLKDIFTDFKSSPVKIDMNKAFNSLWYESGLNTSKTEHGKKHPYDTGYKNKGRTKRNINNRLKSKRAKKARKKNR